MTGSSGTVGARPGAAAAADIAAADDAAATTACAGAAPALQVGLPRWFSALLFSGASVVLSFGTSGLLLADAGRYTPVRVLITGSVGLGLLGLLGQSAGLIPVGMVSAGASSLRLGRFDAHNLLPRARNSALAGCLLVALWTAVNISYAGHHVAINRDAGAYTVTAKWIAEHGTLQVPVDPGWLGSGVPVRFDSFAVYADAGGRLQFQFAHFLPSLLAQADNLGGDRLMFAVPAVLGGLALLAIYATGCVLLRSPWLSLAMVAALAVGLPQLTVSRDTYSETTTELLLWTGLWLCLRWLRDRRQATAVLAGLFLGATAMTRIDALVYFMALPVALALLWRTEQAPRRTMLRSLLGFLAGLLAPVALGTFDQMNRSTDYYRMLHGQVMSLRAAVLAGSVIAVLIVGRRPDLAQFAAPVRVRRWIVRVRRGLARVRRWLVRMRRWLVRVRRWLVQVGPRMTVLGLVGLWVLRPLLGHAHLSTSDAVVSGLQGTEKQPIDGTRTYGEQSMHWMAWYLGPVCLAMAVLGVGVLVAAALAHSSAAEGRIKQPDAVLLLLVVGLGSLLYLWRPSIVPDQIWASRRYVPATLPFLVLSAGLGIEVTRDWLRRRQRGRWRLPARVLAPLPVILAVLAPAISTVPVAQFQAQAGFDAVLRSACPTLGRDAAVLLLPGNRVDDFMTQTLRSWCGVPVARLVQAPNASELAALTQTWRSNGRRLWVLSGDPRRLRALTSGSAVRLLGSAVSTHELEQAISRLPGRYSPPSYLTVYGRQLG